MNNEIEQLAEQHGMTVEFVAWFFGEKKAACGSFWLMMMAAMWEGWKGRDGESTAALATIEKRRKVSGCPAGVDLQGHLRQLAAENVVLASSAECLLHEASEVYRAYNKTQLPDGDLVDGQSLQEVWDAINATPVTDRIHAGIKADGVEEFALMFAEESIKDDIITGCWKAQASRAASEYAELLREGAK